MIVSNLNGKKLSVFVLSLILISVVFIEIYLNMTWSSNETYKKPKVYWELANGTESSFSSLELVDIDGDKIPDFVINNGVNTILIYEIPTKNIFNTIQVKNSTYLVTLDIGKFLLENNSHLEIMVYSVLDNGTGVIYIIDAVNGSYIWDYSFGYDEGVSKLLYYDTSNENIILVGIENVFCINIKSKSRIWTFNVHGVHGYILSSAIFNYSIARKRSGIAEENMLSIERRIAIWSITQYGQSTESKDTYTLYCIDLQNGSLIWMRHFQYPKTGVAYIVSKDLIENGLKRDFNNDNVEDLIVADSENIYIVSGWDGSIIKNITFSNIADAIIDDFDNNGHIEIVVESETGQLIAFSLPDSSKLWSTTLSKTGRLDVVSENTKKTKNILITSSENYVLIKPTTGILIFNNSLLNEFPKLKENNIKVEEDLKCKNTNEEYFTYSWTKPLSEDLNNDSRKEIIIGVYSQEYHIRYRTEKILTKSLWIPSIYFKSKGNNETNHFCMLLVLDPQTGSIIEYVNLTAYGFDYLSLRTYETTLHSNTFVFLLAWAARNIEDKHIVIIKFSENQNS